MFRLISHKSFLTSFSILLIGVIVILACAPNRDYPTSSVSNSDEIRFARININTADATELEKLPHIGRGLAMKIVEHRDRYGPFRKPEHLLVIDGISEKRFRGIRDLITVD